MVDLTIIAAFDDKDKSKDDIKKRLKNSAKAKIRKYKDSAKNLQAKINPLPFTTFGAFTSDVNHWIQDLQDTAAAKGLYFPEIHRKFKIIWRENITFSIARHTACAAINAIEKHRFNSSLMSVN